jgi:hypothetical protein
MQLSLADLEKLVKVNPTMIGEVTNPVMLDRGHTPTYDGLLSTEIFGNTTKERSSKFGFINLQGHYLQPIVFKNLRRIDRRIDGIISGRSKVRIEKDGTMVDDENGSCGINFIYRNWEKIKYKKNSSSIRNERVELFESHSRGELFTDVWLVSPALYRDINLQNIETGKMSVLELNAKYAKLLRLVNMLKTDSSFTPVMYNTQYQIQLCLVEIYDYFKEQIQKKNGIIRKSLLGKSIDYGSRLVITSPTYNIDTYKDTEIDFFHAGIPLSNCCSSFTPFILGWVRNFLQRELEFVANKYPIRQKDGSLGFVPLKDPMAYYSEEMIKKMLDNFVFSYSGRFDKIRIPTEDMDDPKAKPVYMVFTGKELTKAMTGNKISDAEAEKIAGHPLRYMTLTDLFYMAAEEVCRDKHVYITRYPLTDYLGVFPIGIAVMSTINTCEMEYNGRVYKHYPIVKVDAPKSVVASSFVDTVRFQNVYLDVIGGDWITSRSLPHQQWCDKNIVNSQQEVCVTTVAC